MSTSTDLLTANDLLRMASDGSRYELVKGELIEMPPAGSIHGNRTMRLGWRVAQHVEANDLGVVFAAETGFLLATNPDTVRAPDIAFVSKARIEEVGEFEGFWPGAPDLAVEVISPGDSYTDVEEKVEQYLGAGTFAVWVVDPRRRTIAVYRSLTDISILTETDILDGGDLIAGFSCRVTEIFA
ncbi:MAG TPA: Uma2 family endonuclease [Blastocatellia bacterium]|nr:Uma2 family endonuclease [Blastocatellia bacterium]